MNTAKTIVIAITGGIGSGKSVVSRIVEAMGFSVYDCDSEAKQLMDTDAEILRRLADEIDTQVVVNGKIVRERLSQIVFSDSEKLLILNSIVHSAVKRHLCNRIEQTADRLFFFETAILYQSGFDSIADCVWKVVAPEELRVSRVVERNHITPEQVRARIESQKYEKSAIGKPAFEIVNDGIAPVLPQVEEFLREF